MVFFFVDMYDYLIDVDECVSNFCINGGICVDGINGYICICLLNYWGNWCEKG